MKKIYESPIVEITVFDVEDVITTSVVRIDTTSWTANDVESLNNYASQLNANKVAQYSTYSW